MTLSLAEIQKLIEGVRQVNRHDIAVALQATLIRARFEEIAEFVQAGAIIEIIADTAIRSAQRPHDPKKLEMKS